MNKGRGKVESQTPVPEASPWEKNQSQPNVGVSTQKEQGIFQLILQ